MHTKICNNMKKYINKALRILFPIPSLIIWIIFTLLFCIDGNSFTFIDITSWIITVFILFVIPLDIFLFILRLVIKLKNGNPRSAVDAEYNIIKNVEDKKQSHYANKENKTQSTSIGKNTEQTNEIVPEQKHDSKNYVTANSYLKDVSELIIDKIKVSIGLDSSIDEESDTQNKTQPNSVPEADKNESEPYTTISKNEFTHDSTKNTAGSYDSNYVNKLLNDIDIELFARQCNAYLKKQDYKEMQEAMNNQIIIEQEAVPFNNHFQHNTTKDFDSMTGHDFEHFCADLLTKNGFINVEVTPGSGDHGIDILAEKDDITYAIQCKCYSKDINNAAVQQAHTGKSIYNKDIAVVLTNRGFTPQAIEEANALGVKLWGRDKLISFINNLNTM